MFGSAAFLLSCVAVLESLQLVCSQPVSGQAIKLDVRPASGSGSQARPHTVSCSLDASLTSMDKVTALTVHASRPYGTADEFDPLVAVDLWTLEPQLLSGVDASDLDVYGRLGAGENTKSQLNFTWKSPRNGQIRRYRCVANGLDSSGRVVTISITSDAEAPSVSSSDMSSRDNLRLLSQTIIGRVVNTTAELEASVQTVGTDVEVLQRTVDSLEELVKTQNSTIVDLQESLTSFKELYKEAHLRNTFDVDSLEELVKTQNSTIADLQESFTSFKELYKEAHLRNTFDVSDVFNGRRYYISKAVTPFDLRAADSHCAIYGGYLVEIDDQEEFNFVFNFVKTVGGTDNFFTGINNVDEEGVFRFWHSRRPVKFFKWKAREPNNSGNKEHCVEIWVSYNGYNDRSCNFAAKYVCEI